MNFRTTIILIVILALVVGIGVVYTRSRANQTPDVVSPPKPDFFYLVADGDIQKVQITQGGQKATFVQDSEGKWHFDTVAGEPVFMDRWGGITLLLSGPQYKRVIAQNAPDLARYGLGNPSTLFTVGLKGMGDVQIKLGDKTPDGSGQYALFRDGKSVYIIDSSWGGVISRLVTEPPHVPTPVPTPGPAGTETTGPPGTPLASPQPTLQASPQGAKG